jgi:hypothetical protein
MISTRVRQEAKSLLKKFRCIFQHSLIIKGDRSPLTASNFSSISKLILLSKNKNLITDFLHSHNKLKLARFQQLLKQKYTMNLPETLTIVV